MMRDHLRRVLITADTAGGVWIYALDLARGLSSFGIETVLAVLGRMPDTSQWSEAISISGLRLIDASIPLDWDLAVDKAALRRGGASLAALAGDLDVDIVHLNSPILAAYAQFSMPVVGVCHSCLPTWWRAVRGEAALPDNFVWRAAMLGAGYRQCTVLMAPSRSFACATATAYGLMQSPSVVYNGRAQRAAQPVANSAEIFTAGRFWDEGKNLAAIDRAALLGNLAVDAAGPLTGPHGQTAVAANVNALGKLDENQISMRLASKPIFVSTALYEPFGLAVLEAAQAGCALVLSDIPTFRELWDGVAWFVPANDHGAIAAALQLLLDQPDERRRRGDDAKVRAMRYSLDRMTSKTRLIYGQALGISRFGDLIERARA